jgi:hypothetical protein
MSLVRILAALLLVFGLVGCGLGNDEGAEIALKIVQDFKPSASSVSIAQMLQTRFSNDQWLVSKTSEDLYRITFKGSTSGKTEDLIFGVSIYNRSVMALNNNALEYTNPL